MKRIVYFLIVIGFISGSILLRSCQSPAKKEKEAQENVKEAQEDLNEAKRDMATEEEWQQFKDEINSKIEANENRIAELKAERKRNEKTYDSLYSKNIDDLEKRNKELKNRVTDYKNDNDWQSFKRELDYQVNEVDRSVNDMTTKIKHKK
jgi:septal ring factor EnvC (AmiA/AmiB activator)